MPDTTVMITGPIQGTVTTLDGETFDVSNVECVIPLDKAEEVMHLIGSRYAAEGHPNVEGSFDYQPAPDFADYVPHADNQTLTGE